MNYYVKRILPLMMAILIMVMAVLQVNPAYAAENESTAKYATEQTETEQTATEQAETSQTMEVQTEETTKETATESMTEKQSEMNMEEQTENQTENQTESQTENQTESQMAIQTEEQTEKQTEEQTEEQTMVIEDSIESREGTEKDITAILEPEDSDRKARAVEEVDIKIDHYVRGHDSIAPSSFGGKYGGNQGTNWRKCTIDGVKYDVFCIEAPMNAPDDGTYKVTTIVNTNNLAKILYYGYVGYAKSGIDCFFDKYPVKNADTAYYFTHFALSGEKLGTGTGSSGGYWEMTDDGVKTCNALRKYAADKEIPSADLSLTANETTAQSLTVDAVLSGNEQRTPDIRLNSAYEKNAITISVPANVTFHNVTQESAVSDGTAVIHAGDTFYFTAPLNVSILNGNTYSTGTVNGSIVSKNFHAAKLVDKNDSSTQQMAYYYLTSDESTKVALSVNWMEQGSLSVAKIGDTTVTQPGKDCALANARYSIYTNPECTNEVAVLTTDENGNSEKATVQIGTYYVKETAPSPGYLLDETIHTVSVPDENGSMDVNFTSTEPLITGQLEIEKKLIGSYNLSEQELAECLKGITFTITDRDGGVVERLVMDESGYALSRKLPVGTYNVHEEEATVPAGFLPGADVSAVITAHGSIVPVRSEGSDEGYVNQRVYANVKIEKTDERTDKVVSIPGTVFHLERYLTAEKKWEAVKFQTDDGEAVDLIMDETGSMVLSQKLEYGRYRLIETKAPEGYALGWTKEDGKISPEYVFEISDSSDKMVTIKERPQTGRIRITKVDKKTGAHCTAGFQFEVKEKTSGEIVDTIVTGEDGIACSKELPLGQYTVREIVSGEHYSLDETVYEVNLCYDAVETTENYEDGMAGPAPVIYAELKIENEQTAINILKVDSLYEERFLAGVTFAIWSTENDGEVYQTDEEGKIQMTNLKHDTTYYVQETKTLDGYLLNEEKREFYVDKQGHIDGKSAAAFTARNTKPRVEISKQDIAGAELPGAKLTICDSEGKEVEVWTSTAEPHMVEGMLPGIYTLSEIIAPDGYAKAETITFELKDTMEIQKVVMVDEPTHVSVSKVDIAGEELPGARLVIKDSQGKKVEEWISEDTPHLIDGLKTGRYTLTEITAPKGYQVAETVTFEVSDTLEIQKVSMCDKPIEETETEPKETEKILKSVKTGDNHPIGGLMVIFILAGIVSVCGAIRCCKRKIAK